MAATYLAGLKNAQRAGDAITSPPLDTATCEEVAMSINDNADKSLPKSRTELAAIWPPTAGVAQTVGHMPMSPLKAIRRKCLDCSCYQPSEVRLCEAIGCPLWPFRAGRHPYYGLAGKTPSDLADLEEGEAV